MGTLSFICISVSTCAPAWLCWFCLCIIWRLLNMDPKEVMGLLWDGSTVKMYLVCLRKEQRICF
jgi:hypothetical protein